MTPLMALTLLVTVPPPGSAASLAPERIQDVSEEHLAAWNAAMGDLLGGDPEQVTASLERLLDLADKTPTLEDDYLARRLALDAQPGISGQDRPEDVREKLQHQLDLAKKLEDWLSRESSRLDDRLRSSCVSDLARKLEAVHGVARALDAPGQAALLDLPRLEQRIGRLHEQAIEGEEVSGAVLVAAARWGFARGRMELGRVRGLLDRGLDREPDLPEGLVLRACLLLIEGQEARAKQDLERAAQGGLAADAVLVQVASAMEERENQRLALDLLEQAARKTNLPELWFRACTARYEQARRAIRGLGARPAADGGPVWVGEHLAAELLPGLERATESPHPRQRMLAHRLIGVLNLGLGKRAPAVASMRSYLELSSGELMHWIDVRQCLRGAQGMGPAQAMMMLEALHEELGSAAPAGKRWPSAAVLGREYALAGDMAAARRLFVAALEDVADCGDAEYECVIDLARAAVSEGELSPDEAEAFGAHLLEAPSEAAQEKLTVLGQRLQEREYQESLRRGAAMLAHLAGMAASYDPHLEAQLDLMEYVHSLANNPHSFGGVPMATWVDADLTIRSHVIGQPAVLEF